MSAGTKNKALLITSDSRMETDSAPYGAAEAIWQGASISLVIVFLYVIYRNGLKRGQLVASEQYDRKFLKLKDDVQSAMNQMSRSHQRLENELKNSKLIPNNYVLASYAEEGKSLHPRNDGYVMRVERKFEHRAVAESVLGRELAPNEVVHHIYAPAKDDNSLGNLCVLDREQHDLFHTYLTREVKIKGKYPRTADQKVLLKRHYQGILLEDAAAHKKVAFPPISTDAKLSAIAPRQFEEVETK